MALVTFVGFGAILYALAWIGLGPFVADWIDPVFQSIIRGGMDGEIPTSASIFLAGLVNVVGLIIMAILSAIPVGILYQFTPAARLLSGAIAVAVVVGVVLGVTGVGILYGPLPGWNLGASTTLVAVLSGAAIVVTSKAIGILFRRITIRWRGTDKPPLS